MINLIFYFTFLKKIVIVNMSILWWDLWLHKLFESTLYREMIDGHCEIDELKIILHIYIYIWGLYILIAHQIFTSFTILLFNATALVFNQKKKNHFHSILLGNTVLSQQNKQLGITIILILYKNLIFK